MFGYFFGNSSDEKGVPGSPDLASDERISREASDDFVLLPREVTSKSMSYAATAAGLTQDDTAVMAKKGQDQRQQQRTRESSSQSSHFTSEIPPPPPSLQRARSDPEYSGYGCGAMNEAKDCENGKYSRRYGNTLRSRWGRYGTSEASSTKLELGHNKLEHNAVTGAAIALGISRDMSLDKDKRWEKIPKALQELSDYHDEPKHKSHGRYDESSTKQTFQIVNPQMYVPKDDARTREEMEILNAVNKNFVYDERYKNFQKLLHVRRKNLQCSQKLSEYNARQMIKKLIPHNHKRLSAMSCMATSTAKGATVKPGGVTVHQKNCWCPMTSNDKRDFIVLDLGRNMRLSAISTQGRYREYRVNSLGEEEADDAVKKYRLHGQIENHAFEWVKSYRVYYHCETESEKALSMPPQATGRGGRSAFKERLGKQPKKKSKTSKGRNANSTNIGPESWTLLGEFKGNNDNNTEVAHKLVDNNTDTQGITARYIRIQPINFYGQKCMRVGLYGTGDDNDELGEDSADEAGLLKEGRKLKDAIRLANMKKEDEEEATHESQQMSVQTKTTKKHKKKARRRGEGSLISDNTASFATFSIVNTGAPTDSKFKHSLRGGHGGCSCCRDWTRDADVKRRSLKKDLRNMIKQRDY